MTGGVATYSVDYYKLGYQTGLMALKFFLVKQKLAIWPSKHKRILN